MLIPASEMPSSIALCAPVVWSATSRSCAEVAIARRIYVMYIDMQMADVRIAQQLNSEGLRTDTGRAWIPHVVKQVLSNEKYVGTMTFNRSTQHMRSTRRANSPDKWIRRENAFAGVVSRGGSDFNQRQQQASTGNFSYVFEF
ncbi:hypothetical protein HHL21_04530 [Massilia sp. RP-1-19]|uniref:Recombinase domain-containing protein n=1 Tax=Massilia polaris TaxID=2728846 RepID=A0A848HFX8_9BURK|nr:recombinase family protein [Massilia polaris]NML60365.1 hypothetical protein [Massilia polaris]